MSDLVKIDPKEFGVEENKAKELTTGLTPHLQERELLIQEFQEIKHLELTQENCKVFRELRLKFQKNRTQGIKDWHKTAKEIPLRLSQLIDAIKRKEESVNQTYESKLEDGEKHFEKLEKQRLENLQNKRVELLSKYVEDAQERDLSSMDEDVWEAYLATKKQAYKDKIEAEKKAEAERLENERKEKLRWKRSEEIRPVYSFFKDDGSIKLEELSEKEYQKLLGELKKAKAEHEAEQERIRQENERLRKEAESEKAKQAKLEAERKAKEEKERKAHEEEIKKEREERAKIEAKLKAKAEAEEKAKREEEVKKQDELSKGDEDKFKDFVIELSSLKSKYDFKSKEFKKKYNDATQLIDKILNYIN